MVLLTHPDIHNSEKIFGVDSHEFAAFCLPGMGLFNQRFDFSVSTKPQEISLFSVSQTNSESLKFVSYPQELPESICLLDRRISCFNILLAFDEDKLSDATVDSSWQTLFAFSQGLLSEERRTRYLSLAANKLLQSGIDHQNTLRKSLVHLFNILTGTSQLHHVIINESVQVPVNQPRNFPSIDLMMTCFVPLQDEHLRPHLLKDAMNAVCWLESVLEPFKSLKESIIELSFSSPLMLKIISHLVSHKLLLDFGVLNESSRLVVAPGYQISVTPLVMFEFSNMFGSSPTLFEICGLFTDQVCYQELMDVIYARYGINKVRFTQLCRFLFQKRIIALINEGLFYSPLALLESKAIVARQQLGTPSAFTKNIPFSIRKKFSQQEILAIHAKLGCDSAKTETILKLIAEVVMDRLNLASAESQIIDVGINPSDDFRKLVEQVLSGSEPFLVRYYS